MNIKTLSGIVSNNNLPLLEDEFLGIIHPSEVVYRDTFETGAGILLGRPLSHTPSATWQGWGSTASNLEANEGGWVSPKTTSGTPSVVLPCLAKGKVYAAIEAPVDAERFAGINLLEDINDFDKYTQVVINRASGVVVLQRYEAEGRTLFTTIPVSFDDYPQQHLTVEWSPTSLIVYYNFKKIYENLELSNLKVAYTGITVARNIDYKIWEFITA